MSERMMSQATYERISANDPGPGRIDAVSTYDDWQDTLNSYNQDAWDDREEEEDEEEEAASPTIADTLAAELASILAHIGYVKCQANHKLDGPENHELFLAWKKTSELLTALKS